MQLLGVLAMHCWPGRLSFFPVLYTAAHMSDARDCRHQNAKNVGGEVYRKPSYDLLGRVAWVSLRQAGSLTREASASVLRVAAVGTVVWRWSLIVGGTRGKRGRRVM
jgi:hypothetical protein